MKTMRDFMEMAVSELNSKYLTITELAKKMGYSDNAFISRKAQKLKLGFKVKQLVLLSEEEQEILKKSIKRKNKT